MHIYDFLFIIQLFVVIGIVMYKIFNIMHVGKLYDIKIVWIGLIIYLFAYLIGLVVFLMEPERLIYSVLFRIDSFLLVLTVMLTIIEFLLHVGAIGEQGIKPYESKGLSKFSYSPNK